MPAFRLLFWKLRFLTSAASACGRRARAQRYASVTAHAVSFCAACATRNPDRNPNGGWWRGSKIRPADSAEKRKHSASLERDTSATQGWWVVDPLPNSASGFGGEKKNIRRHARATHTRTRARHARLVGGGQGVKLGQRAGGEKKTFALPQHASILVWWCHTYI